MKQKIKDFLYATITSAVTITLSAVAEWYAIEFCMFNNKPLFVLVIGLYVAVMAVWGTIANKIGRWLG